MHLRVDREREIDKVDITCGFRRQGGADEEQMYVYPDVTVNKRLFETLSVMIVSTTS